jgi:Bifunctional DNA primase/polymerase, N-terminal
MREAEMSAPLFQSGRYSQFQPVYAELGLAVFPCSSDKVPLISHYQKMGIPASRQMAARFTEANGLGIMAGERSGITDLDIDSTDRGVLKEAIHRHGEPRVITQTASGKFHCLYRHSGEGRHIRPWGKDLPIDLLGGGVIIMPPSLFGVNEYHFVRGQFDDLKRLTPIIGLDDSKERRPPGQKKTDHAATAGNRNIWLYRQCMRAAHHCDTLEVLVDVARTRNEECDPPMEDTEVMKVAANAWNYTLENKNRFGGYQHGAWIPFEVLATMQGDADAMYLLTFLKVHQGPLATFMITNSLHEQFGWSLVRLQRARSTLIESKYIHQVRAPAARRPGNGGSAALYRWND